MTRLRTRPQLDLAEEASGRRGTNEMVFSTLSRLAVRLRS
jgi:hypothetical protein